jgi:hypothetical protein
MRRSTKILIIFPGASMLFYRAALPLSAQTLFLCSRGDPASSQADRLVLAQAEPWAAGAAGAGPSAANSAHARLRGPGERANAQLKPWGILRKLRCCPWHAGKLAKATHVLQLQEARVAG